MRIFTKAFCLITFLLLGYLSSYAQTVNPNAVDGQIYYQLKAQANFTQGEKGVLAVNQVAFLDALKDIYQITAVARPFYQANDPDLQRTYLLKFKNIHAVDSLIRDLKKDKDVAYAEKAPLFRILYTPNDPEYGSSALHRWYLGVIHAEQAWDIQKGNPHIKIAIVDNAIYVDHPDLKNKIVEKIDLANGDTDPTPPKQTLEWSHGTHTSGLAGAETDNGTGIASIGFKVSLLAVKVSSDSTDGSTMSYGYQGIVWAADHGANVMNLSWGGPGYYQTGQNVVNYAYNKGCVIVASAGNDGNTSLTYPAAYNHVIAVASTDGNDKKSYFSTYGSFVDVCAPGGTYFQGNGIYSTVDLATSKYGYMQGTSMASPIVAGLCGLMLSQDSTLTPEKLKAILKVTCDNIDTLNPDYSGKLGAGRINAFAAVQAVADSMDRHTIISDFMASSVSIPVGATVSFNDKSTKPPVSWKWVFEGGNPSVSTLQNPSNIEYDKPGSYSVSLTVSDGTNSNTETKTNYIIVYPLISGAWLPQSTGFIAQSRGINYISIVNPDLIWANAYDGSGQGAIVHEFTKTTDGGNTWTPGKYSGMPSSYVVSTISAVSADSAWVAMYASVAGNGYGGIYSTSDGGNSWSHQSTASFSDAASFPNIVYFWDAHNGFCQGDPTSGSFEIYTTTDGGANWIRVPKNNIPSPKSGEYGYTNLYSVYGNTVWFGTNQGRVFKSTDKGLHWSMSSTGLAEVNTLGFHDDSIGFVTYIPADTLTDFKMEKSVDGGLTWAAVNPTGDYYKSGLAVVPDAPGLLVSTGITQDLATSGSAYSLDEGDTWTQLDDSIQYTTVKFYSSTVGWAGGFNESSSSRGIWKWLGIPTTAVAENPVEQQKLTIFPNPSTGVVSLSFPAGMKMSGISIYDMQGRLVRSINSGFGDGSRVKTIDLSHLKKGVYIAIVRGDKGALLKQKFILK